MQMALLLTDILNILIRLPHNMNSSLVRQLALLPSYCHRNKLHVASKYWDNGRLEWGGSAFVCIVSVSLREYASRLIMDR